MIKKLRVGPYGKFEDASFEFASVTVFLGENEAGKTTLFDALVDGLCRPGANIRIGQGLKDRYGPDRVAEIDFDSIPPEPLPSEDFMNVFAVRAGSLGLDIPENSGWMNRVKSGLFSDGIDPAILVQSLDRDTSVRANSPYGKEKKRLSDELAAIRTRLAEAKDRRASSLAEEERVRSLEIAHAGAKEERETLQAETAAMDSRLAQQKAIRELKKAKEASWLASELSATAERLEKTVGFAADRSAEISNLEKEAAAAEVGLAGIDTLLGKARSDADALAGEKAAREGDRQASGRLASVATQLKLALGDKASLVSRRTVTEWNRAALIAAIAVFAAGLAGLALLPPPVSFICLGAGVLGAFVLLMAAKKTREVEDSSALDARIAKAKEEWRARTGETLSTTSFEELLVGLDRAVQKAGEADRAAAIAAEALAKKEAELRSLEADASRARERLEAARGAVSRWLSGFGLSSRDAYVAALQERRSLAAKALDLERRAGDAAAAFGLLGPETLQAECARRIASLEGSIVEAEIPDADLRALENSLRAKRSRLEELDRIEKEYYGDFKGSLAAARTAFRDIPETIARLEREAAETEARLKDLETNLAASNLAKRIFESIATDSTAMLEALSGEIGEAYSGIVAVPSSVGFPAFSAEGATAADASGTPRPGARLSSGTRDAFYLAARLSLAEKTGLRDVPVVLDEPFLAMDSGRIGNAFALIKAFVAKTGWQVVVFTKEAEVADSALAVFPDALLHRLTRSVPKGGA
jgi:uncharacterized protein YhaN